MGRRHRGGALGLLAAIAVAFYACRRGEPESTAAGGGQAEVGSMAPPVEVPATRKRQHPPLPEDPVLAAKATAQSREHQEEEERHRRLCYDRDRLEQHAAVVSSIQGLRQRYDRAKSSSAVSNAQAQVKREIPAIQKKIDGIDPWKNSSLLLADYDAMLKLLGEPYPSALVASMVGQPADVATLTAELDRHAKSTRELLSSAAACEDE